MHSRRSSRPSGRNGAKSSRLPACILMNDCRQHDRRHHNSRHRPAGAADRRRAADPRRWPLCRRSEVSRNAGSGVRAQPARPRRHSRHRRQRRGRLPGVHAVFTLVRSRAAADRTSGCRCSSAPISCRPDVAPFVLAKDEVAFVGEAVAIVVAQSRAIAEDAAALVEVDYEPLPAVSDCRDALRAGRAAGAPRQDRATCSSSSASPTAISRRRSRARRIPRASASSSTAAAPIRWRAAAPSRSMTPTKTG